MKYSTFLSFLLWLVAIVLVVFTSGCPPESTCLSAVPHLDYSEDICAPNLYAIELERPNGAVADLPNFCPDINYENAHVVRISPPKTNRLILHHYQGFVGKSHIEVIGYNCADSTSFLFNQQCVANTAIVGTQTISTVSSVEYDSLLIRVIPLPDAGSSASKPTFQLAIFEALPTPNVINLDQSSNDGSVGRTVLDCSGTRTNRLVISAKDPDFDLAKVAEHYGLPIVQMCPCDKNLLAVEVPYGIDLETTKPIVKELPPDVDTTASGLAIEFDFIINLPIIAFNSNGQNQDTGGPLPDDLEELGIKNPPSQVFGPDCALFSPPTEDISGGGPLVVIIDSGVDTSVAHRSLFRPFAERELLLCDGLTMGPLGYDFLNGDPLPADDLGHGTGVAGALLSTYPQGKKLRLQHYKFVGPEGGTYFGAVCGMQTAVAHEADLLNLSWGIRTDTLPNALKLALEACEAANIIVVTSAGNDSLNITATPNWPASASSAFSNIVTVGSYDYISGTSDPQRMAFSNFGADKVALVAPFGLDVPKLGGGFHEQVGTSISAPQLTAHLAAMRADQPDLSLEDALEMLRRDGLLLRAATLNGTEIKDQQYLELNCKLSL